MLAMNGCDYSSRELNWWGRCFVISEKLSSNFNEGERRVSRQGNFSHLKTSLLRVWNSFWADVMKACKKKGENPIGPKRILLELNRPKIEQFKTTDCWTGRCSLSNHLFFRSTILRARRGVLTRKGAFTFRKKVIWCLTFPCTFSVLGSCFTFKSNIFLWNSCSYRVYVNPKVECIKFITWIVEALAVLKRVVSKLDLVGGLDCKC